MSDFQLLSVIAGSAVAVAVCTAVIAWCAVSVQRSVRNLEQRAESVLAKWEPLAEETGQAVKEFSEQSGELLSRLNSLSAELHKQAQQTGAVLDQLASSAQDSIMEVDSAVKDAVTRFSAMSAGIDRALRAPVTKLKALIEGVSAALRHLARGAPRSPERVSTDEEMFI